MEITYAVFNRQGMTSNQTTGKANRALTADEVLAFLAAKTNAEYFTIVGSNGNRIPAPWFLEGDR